jgi:hypothetical protein
MAVCFVILIAIAIALVVVGVGIALAAVTAIAIALLVSAGIVSSSLIVGFKTGSATNGIRLALLQIGTAVGAVAGLGIATGLKLYFATPVRWAIVGSLGFTTGICVGILIGASFGLILKLAIEKWGPQRGFEALPVVDLAAPIAAPTTQDLAIAGGNNSRTDIVNPGSIPSPAN